MVSLGGMIIFPYTSHIRTATGMAIDLFVTATKHTQAYYAAPYFTNSTGFSHCFYNTHEMKGTMFPKL